MHSHEGADIVRSRRQRMGPAGRERPRRSGDLVKPDSRWAGAIEKWAQALGPGNVIAGEAELAAANRATFEHSSRIAVVLRPTTLKADQILFRAVAPGGTSLAADDNFPSARVADDVIPAGGVGKLSALSADSVR